MWKCRDPSPNAGLALALALAMNLALASEVAAPLGDGGWRVAHCLLLSPSSFSLLLETSATGGPQCPSMGRCGSEGPGRRGTTLE